MITKIQLKHVFPGFEKKWYDEVSHHGILKYYSEYEWIVKPSEHEDSVLLLLKGLMKIYRSNKDGSDFFLYFLEPGEACALSLQHCQLNSLHQLMARSVSESSVVLIPFQKAKDWMRQFEQWSHFVTTTYFNRFDELLKTIDNIAFQQMEERLLSYLEKQSSLSGNEIKLTHLQIANDLNTSREVISRLLKKLENKGKISMQRSNIIWLPESISIINAYYNNKTNKPAK